MKQKTGLIGTIQKKIGQETHPVKNTTPDALQLQKAFHHMYNKQVDIAIMEVSSHALDMGRVYGCDFDKIGRASCREIVERIEGDGEIEGRKTRIAQIIE